MIPFLLKGLKKSFYFRFDSHTVPWFFLIPIVSAGTYILQYFEMYLIRDGLKNPLQFIIGHKRKSPKSHLRALKKSYCDQPEAPPTYIFSTSSSGCLQYRRHVPSAIDPDSLPMVRFDFLHLPGLLQRTSLLQRSMPLSRKTKKPLRSAKAVSPNQERSKSAPRSRKSSPAWPE